jgi:hypothetical protein
MHSHTHPWLLLLLLLMHTVCTYIRLHKRHRETHTHQLTCLLSLCITPPLHTHQGTVVATEHTPGTGHVQRVLQGLG